MDERTPDPADPIVGHKTLRDGNGLRHVPLHESEAAALLADCEKRAADRAALMPDEEAAIAMFFDAYTRLKELGWNDACYCPKDRSQFLVIEAGSTGQHRCFYEGEWPFGSWWVVDDGDMYPSRPVLFKRLAGATHG